jgi:hypothetical protein
VPNKYYNITTQVRRKIEVNDYDDIHESVYVGGAKSAFFDELSLDGNEASIKLSVRPVKRIEAVGRYQLFDNNYDARFENQIKQQSKVLSHVFTYDLNLQPLDPWFLTLSYSKSLSKTSTPAGASTVSTTKTPGFTSDVDSWLVSSSYAISERLNIIKSFQYSVADNFNDYTTNFLPLGADYKRYDISTGLEWRLKDDIAIAPHYAYAMYRANQEAEATNYSAHIIWLDVNVKW